MRVHVGLNRAHPASGIVDAVWACRLDSLNGDRRAAVYCHPMGTGMVDLAGVAALDGQRALLTALAEAGYPVAASDMGYMSIGSGWGNAAQQTRTGELDAWAAAGAGGSTAPRVVVATSAGAAGAVNYYGKAPGHVADVAAMVLVLPVWDLDNAYQTDPGGARASIEAAHGVTYDDPLPAGASPKDNTALLDGIPTRIYYATDDPICDGDIAADMAAAFGDNAEAISLGALGHTEEAIAAIDTADLTGWLRDVAPPS